jgi:hypothetical protein
MSRNTDPDIVHIESNTICRYSLMIERFEQITRTVLVYKSAPELRHFLLKLFWNENLMG